MTDEPPKTPGFFRLPKDTWAAIASLSGVAAILTLIFGVMQYSGKLESDRAKQTLDFVAEWREKGYRDHFRALAAMAEAEIQLHLTDEDLAHLQESEDAQRKAAAKISKLVIQKNPTAATSLDEVVYFFNLVGLCVEAKLCSKKTAKDFFDSTLVDFYDIFESQIVEIQKTQPDYASGMIDLVGEFRD